MFLKLHRTHLARGRLGRDAWLDPGYHVTLMACVAVPHFLCNKCGCIRQPQLNLRIGIVERPRQHAYDLVRLTIEPDSLADDGWITGESSLEEAPGEDNYVLALRLIFLGRKRAAVGQRNAENRKQIP